GVLRMVVSDEVIEENQKAVLGQAVETVRRRVDAFGMAEPNIYPKNRQVVIELPGVSDTATEVRAAANEAANQLVDVLTGAGTGQIQVLENRDDPGTFELRTPEQDALAQLEQAFGANKLIEQDDGSTLISDDRFEVGLAILPVDAGAEPDPETVSVTLTEAARDMVLESSSDFRRLLKVIDRAAVLEMHM